MAMKNTSATVHAFNAPIIDAGGGGMYVEIPFDVEETFGKKRVPVAATFDGEPYRGLVVRMGGEHHILIVLKEIREKIGKGAGDRVEVTVAEDTEPRVIEPPKDFAAALADHPAADEYFRKLSYSHRREYVKWIEEAKREQTRIDRIAKAVQMLSQGKKQK
jgi:hypothetical protein